MASQGFSIDGSTQIDNEMYFALKAGWPLAGTGRTVYETAWKRGNRVVNRTRYDFQTKFEVTIRRSSYLPDVHAFPLHEKWR